MLDLETQSSQQWTETKEQCLERACQILYFNRGLTFGQIFDAIRREDLILIQQRDNLYVREGVFEYGWVKYKGETLSSYKILIHPYEHA